VLSYFLTKPSAAESLEDIARWRLRQAAISRTVEETSEAIEWLIEKGLLERLDTRASGPLFRLNVTTRQQAEQLLARLTDEDA